MLPPVSPKLPLFLHLPQSPKSATLPSPKKRKGSLTRLLSFGKSKKKEGPVTSFDSSGVEGSQETLSEEVGVVATTFAVIKNKESLDSSGVEGSRETVCESLEAPSPGPAPRLHNTLRKSLPFSPPKAWGSAFRAFFVFVFCCPYHT